MYLRLVEVENGILEKKGDEIIKECEKRIKDHKDYISFLKYVLENVKYKKDGKEFKDFKKGFKSDKSERDAFKSLGYTCFGYHINERSGNSYELDISYCNETDNCRSYENKYVYISKNAYEKYDKDYDVESYEFVIYCIKKQLKTLEEKLKQYEETDYKGTIKDVMNKVEKFIRDIYATGIYDDENSALRDIGYMMKDALNMDLL